MSNPTVSLPREGGDVRSKIILGLWSQQLSIKQFSCCSHSSRFRRSARLRSWALRCPSRWRNAKSGSIALGCGNFGVVTFGFSDDTSDSEGR